VLKTFELIKNITLFENSNWDDKIFITVDTDWASEEVILESIGFLDEYEARATFFATHWSNSMQKLLNNNNYEVGCHPNFNSLLEGGHNKDDNYILRIKKIKEIYPNAVSTRSHSLTQSTPILDELVRQGFKYDVNTFIPIQSGIQLKPWYYWKKDLLKIPFCWEDDVHLHYNMEVKINSLLESKGLIVIGLHPIHIYLNTDSIERYLMAKPYLNDLTKLSEYRNKTKYGIRNFLSDLFAKVNNY